MCACATNNKHEERNRLDVSQQREGKNGRDGARNRSLCALQNNTNRGRKQTRRLSRLRSPRPWVSDARVGGLKFRIQNLGFRV
jgi:hypothetical protein